MKRVIVVISLIFIIALLLAGGVKGKVGNPIFYQTNSSRDIELGGPFESSGNNSRYALTEAIVEDKTFFLNDERAQFSSPDIVYFRGNYFSIFMPGVSLMGVPFYMLGKVFGLAQLFTFLSVTILALLNVFLVIRLAKKLKVGMAAAIISGAIFIFATNAFAYAFTFTQHHLSVTLLLLALINVLSKRTLVSNIILGVILTMAAIVDTPNVFLLSPIGLYAIYKHFKSERLHNKLKLSIKLKIVGIIMGIVPILAIFGWYNYSLTETLTKLPQNIGRAPFEQLSQDRTGISESTGNLSLVNLPFNPRRQLSGFNILLFNNERGLFFYSPVLLFGLLGLVLAYRSRDDKIKNLAVLSSAIIATNVVIYSMFHDPWGGWAFGPRYLIPSAAIISIFIGIGLQKIKRNILFLLAFLILAVYSLVINISGGITTTQVPPKVEAVNLAKPIPYTYLYNFDLINTNFSGSLVYNLYLAEFISVRLFLYTLTGTAFGGLMAILYVMWRNDLREEKIK